MKNQLFIITLWIVLLNFFVPLTIGGDVLSVQEFPARRKEFTSDSNQKLTVFKIESSEVSSNLEILFDREKKSTKQVRYELSFDEQHSTNTKVCENMNVGEEILDEKFIKECYEKNNQKIILSNTPFSPFGVSGEDDKNVNLLVPQPLAPRQDFSDESSTVPACSYLVTTPMWKNVAEGAWKRVKDYVRLVALVTEKPLKIITGTYGTLKYHDASQRDRDLFLTSSDQVPVPRAFWTLVMRKLPAYGKEISETYYGIILVTENGNYSEESKSRICEIIECEYVGWAGINKNVIGPQTYCCKFNDNNLKHLNINISGIQFPIFSLKLRIFPYGFNHEGSLITKNVIDLVADQESINENVVIKESTSPIIES